MKKWQLKRFFKNFWNKKRKIVYTIGNAKYGVVYGKYRKTNTYSKFFDHRT